MPKTLLVAEKPSVGQDLARVLPGPFKKGEGFLEGPEHVITWAVGHLVQLAEPEAYDAKYKSWRMADLPIVPERFKLEVRDERSRKQMSVVTKQLGRDDVEEVVNACDAGREGELIFAYLFEKAKGKKPVKRLWLNSMTTAAMKSALASLRPAEEFELLEEAARSRSEADWIVGMNATRAATIRLRSSFDGAVSLGRVQTPTLAIVARREEEIKAFKPEPYWLVDATFAAEGALPGEESASGARVYLGHFQAPAGSQGTTKGPRIGTEEEALAIVGACEGRPGTITKLEKKEQR
jgi:DNA topoisomerase-3